MLEFKKSILQEIQNQKNVYVTDNSRFIADYNNELETIKAYNGRQLLELLQNADDEISEEVLIDINTHNNILRIANRGGACKPFSEGGIKSLMVSNFSPKTTKKYIGNKGLGFRSIVNWSNKITINSQNIDISFSKSIADRFYNSICDPQKQKEIAEQRNLTIDVKPIAFLAVPELVENIQDSWTTVIEIEYKKAFLADIIKQIENIDDEILLFVNYINKIKISIDSQIKTIERIKDKDSVYVNEKLWTIYTKTDKLLPELWDKENEEENYELKIAVQEDFDNKDNLLYSYFPTNIDIDFPFIIHGTFDLNSSRNDLNKNPKNIFVLERLVELIVETAKKLTVEEVSYKAIELLTHNNRNITLEKLGFYKNIDASIDKLPIFPCLDNKYRKKNEVIHITDTFSEFIINTENQSLFPNLLIPHNNKVDIEKFDITNTISTKKLNDLSANIQDLDDRVELIFLFHETFKHENQLVFLVDSNNELVGLDDEVYTPISRNYDINIPDFVKIKFINNVLFEKLLKKFKITSNEKARDLQRLLKSITNIQSYEPAQILQKIISATNKELENESVDKFETIKEMVLSLFENFKVLGEKTKIPENTKIQLITKNYALENSKNLFLSKSFPSGKLTEYLFGNLFEVNTFLANIEFYNFAKSENVEQIERFFLWLGVNKFTKYSKKSKDYKYDQFLLKKVKRPASFSSFAFNMRSISDLENIKKLSKENFIVWALKDHSLREELYKEHEIKYIKSGGWVEHHYTYNAPSYVLYQLTSSELFNNYLIASDKLSRIVNEHTIDYNYELFKKYEIKKSDIESLVLKIGAVDKFKQLSPEVVTKNIRDLPVRSPDCKQTLSIYKEAVEHYKLNGLPLNNPDILLAAKKEDEIGYFSQSEIYYNGNIKLPKRITRSKAILNFPRRQNTKKVIKYFGINNLSSVNISINKYTINRDLSKCLQDYLRNIITFILVYRFEDSTTESSRRKDLSSIRNVSIQLCDQVIYQIDDEIFELEDNDYIRDNKNYFIKIDKTKSFDDLRKELDFRDTFADIVGSVFDITDTEKYSRIISDNLHETEEIIKRNIGYDSIVRVREFLGISDEYYSFWKTIYSIKKIDYQYTSDKNLLDKIKGELLIVTPIEKIEYNDLKSFKSCEYIEQLFNELSTDIKSFNLSSFSFYKLDFEKYHKLKLKTCFNNNFYHFKQLLYKWCQNNSKEKEFLGLIALYEHKDEIIDGNIINVDYQALTENFVKETYEFALEDTVSSQIDFEKIYDRNKIQIDSEILESSNELRSLLYFEDKLDVISDIIEDIRSQAQKNDHSNPIETEIKNIVPVNLSSPTHRTRRRKRTSKPYKHSTLKSKKNKVMGDTAEREVYNSLVSEFGKENVEWTSIDDDSLGYDIRYKNKNSLWKYVEVKTFSNGVFYLSKNEKMFSENHKDSYELFLVGDDIYQIIDIDFSNADRFELVANEYEVNYEIQS